MEALQNLLDPIYTASETKLNDPNHFVIGHIEPKMDMRYLAVESGNKICKAIDIKSNEPNLVVIGSIKSEIEKRYPAVKSSAKEF